MIARKANTVDATVSGTMFGSFVSSFVTVSPLILALATKIPRLKEAMLRKMDATRAIRFSVKNPINPRSW